MQKRDIDCGARARMRRSLSISVLGVRDASKSGRRSRVTAEALLAAPLLDALMIAGE